MKHPTLDQLPPRDLLVKRIEALLPNEKTAYSLRYEHELSDSDIGYVLGISEEEVAKLMLRALLKLTKATE